VINADTHLLHAWDGDGIREQLSVDVHRHGMRLLQCHPALPRTLLLLFQTLESFVFFYCRGL
jgi:hypothetical protein